MPSRDISVLEYTSDDTAPPTRRTAEHPRLPKWWYLPRRTVITLVLTVLMPVLLGTGMALAYLGAFHAPEPHHLPIAVVGDSPQSQVFAQHISEASDGGFEVRTVPDADHAQHLIKKGTVAAAFQVAATSTTLYVARAASSTTADILTTVFVGVSDSLSLPMTVTDVIPPHEGDTSGQGLFFMLVALSVGSYASAIAVSSVLARGRLFWRLAAPVAVSFAIAALVTVVTGPIYHVIDRAEWGILLLSWLYCLGVVLVGVALHPIFRHWTTLALAGMFVMLNFTSSGGVFSAAFMPDFFRALNSFWDGAAFVHATTVVEYLGTRSFGGDALVLALWVVVGAVAVTLTHAWSVRRTRIAEELTRLRDADTAVA